MGFSERTGIFARKCQLNRDKLREDKHRNTPRQIAEALIFLTLYDRIMLSSFVGHGGRDE